MDGNSPREAPRTMTLETPKKSLTWGHYHEEGTTSFKSYILNTFFPKSEPPPALYGVYETDDQNPAKQKLVFIIVLTGMLVECIPILRNPVVP